ncbi:MAG: LapA family protein [Candidatus Hydrothermarchaeota archaeon]
MERKIPFFMGILFILFIFISLISGYEMVKTRKEIREIKKSIDKLEKNDQRTLEEIKGLSKSCSKCHCVCEELIKPIENVTKNLGGEA